MKTIKMMKMIKMIKIVKIIKIIKMIRTIKTNKPIKTIKIIKTIMTIKMIKTNQDKLRQININQLILTLIDTNQHTQFYEANTVKRAKYRSTRQTEF